MIAHGYNRFLRSNTSRLVVLMGLICMLLTAFKYCNIWIVVIQMFIFSSFAYSINCKFYGGCYYTGVFPVFITTFITLFLICDFLGIFDNYKKVVMKIYDAFDEPYETHVKKLLFPKDEQISNRFKNRTVPKLFNKNYKYDPSANTLNRDEPNEFKDLKHKIVDDSKLLGKNISNNISNKLINMKNNSLLTTKSAYLYSDKRN